MNRILPLVVLVLLGANVRLAAQPPVKVSVAPVVLRDFTAGIDVLGEARASRQAEVTAEIAGKVREANVDRGDRVEAGQVLVALDTVLMEIHRRRAQAELRLAREQLAEYVAGSREEDVREARAALEEAKARLDETQREEARIESLRATDVTSERDMTLARMLTLAAKELVQQRQAALDRVVAGPRKEVVARAEAQVAVREAELEEIDWQIERAAVRAPFAGAVIEKRVEPGHYVNPGVPLVTLSQLDPIEVIIDVPEQFIARVSRGNDVALRFDAHPGEELAAAVESVIPAADPLARTFPVRILVPNADWRLLPGMVARAYVPISAEVGGGPAVPLDALVRSPRGVSVYVIEDGVARAVPVVPGVVQGNLIQVQGEIGVQDVVAVRGNERLFPGSRVEVVTAGDEDTAEEQGP